jgi:hypothetical protein
VFGVQSRARRTVAVGGATDGEAGVLEVGDDDDGEPPDGLGATGTGEGPGPQPTTRTMAIAMAGILMWTPFLCGGRPGSAVS